MRTKVTKGPGSRAAGFAMGYKLIEAAQGRWRAVNAPHLVALVRNRTTPLVRMVFTNETGRVGCGSMARGPGRQTPRRRLIVL